MELDVICFAHAVSAEIVLNPSISAGAGEYRASLLKPSMERDAKLRQTFQYSAPPGGSRPPTAGQTARDGPVRFDALDNAKDLREALAVAEATMTQQTDPVHVYDLKETAARKTQELIENDRLVSSSRCSTNCLRFCVTVARQAHTIYPLPPALPRRSCITRYTRRRMWKTARLNARGPVLWSSFTALLMELCMFTRGQPPTQGSIRFVPLAYACVLVLRFTAPSEGIFPFCECGVLISAICLIEVASSATCSALSMVVVVGTVCTVDFPAPLPTSGTSRRN